VSQQLSTALYSLLIICRFMSVGSSPQALASYDPSLSHECGYWYAFPKAGECKSSERPMQKMLPALLEGDRPSGQHPSQQCTWRRQPMARVLYGSDLVHAGWDKSPSFDQQTGVRLNTTAQTLSNGHILEGFLARGFRQYFSSPRCCGC
jgi:hypothetical protein